MSDLSWWREAKFGMFIHWGLYAIPAGIWKGQEVFGIGEWIMKRAQIPVDEYEELAKEFNPVQFDAESWVKLAKDAGMKYLIITAKHHDGFAMYDSKCSNYNIVDATPYGKDIINELAQACHKENIKLCFYYSQVQDWHHPDGVGNDWDYSNQDFSKYLEEKVKPQLRELLTQYGPVGIIWFDTPMDISRKDSQMLADLVHELQPDCIVSGRIGHGVGDYKQMGDNRIPFTVYNHDWETPATLNDTWGYKKNDHNWKSAKTLIKLLVDINSKGGNYLLNVGPKADGVIPEPSVNILKNVGKWMDINGEAIYGTNPAPVFPYELNWGGVTAKPGKLYLHIFEWPKNDSLRIYGITNKIKRACFLADKSVEIDYEQSYEYGRDEHRLNINLPIEPLDKEIATVILLEIEGEPVVQSLT